VVDKPLIQYAVEEAYASGVRHMVFVTGRSKRAIEDHFDTAYELENELSSRAARTSCWRWCARCSRPTWSAAMCARPRSLGLGHAVLCAERTWWATHPFAVLLADDLMTGPPGGTGGPERRWWQTYQKRWAAFGAGRPAGPRLTRSAATASWRANRPGATADPHRAHRREARAGAGALAHGRGRPLHPHAAHLRRAAHPAARRGRRDPAHRRHRPPDGQRSASTRYQYSGKRYDCGSKEGFLEATVELALQHPQDGRAVSATT
jgi:UTP--glucose-1-phosphate uridylyltransferase